MTAKRRYWETVRLALPAGSRTETIIITITVIIISRSRSVPTVPFRNDGGGGNGSVRGNQFASVHSLTHSDSLKCNAEQSRREDDVENDGKEEEKKKKSTDANNKMKEMNE